MSFPYPYHWISPDGKVNGSQRQECGANGGLTPCRSVSPADRQSVGAASGPRADRTLGARPRRPHVSIARVPICKVFATLLREKLDFRQCTIGKQLLKCFDELISSDLGVTENLREKATANYFTAMHRDHGCPPIRMAKVVMTAPCTHFPEAEPSEYTNKLLP